MLGYTNRMFKMCGEPTICSNNCPVVLQDSYISGPCIDHGSRPQPYPARKRGPHPGGPKLGTCGCWCKAVQLHDPQKLSPQSNSAAQQKPG